MWGVWGVCVCVCVCLPVCLSQSQCSEHEVSVDEDKHSIHSMMMRAESTPSKHSVAKGSAVPCW